MTDDINTAFERLGLDVTASRDDVRKAYTHLAKLWHPDKNQATDTTEKFQEINNAYIYLTEHFTKLENIDYDPETYDHVKIVVNTASVYIQVHHDLIEVWLNACKNKYSEANIIDRGDNGTQFRVAGKQHTLLGSLSITVYKTTAALHIQGTSAFLWLEEIFTDIKAEVDEYGKSHNLFNKVKRSSRIKARISSKSTGKRSCPYCAECDTVNMMACTNCKAWLHHKCTKLDRESLHRKMFTPEEFQCPTCEDLDNKQIENCPLLEETAIKPFVNTEVIGSNQCEGIELKTAEVSNNIDTAHSLPTSEVSETKITEMTESCSFTTDTQPPQQKPDPTPSPAQDNIAFESECNVKQVNIKPDNLENKCLGKVADHSQMSDLKSKFLSKARSLNSPRKTDSEIWSKEQAQHLCLLETNITKTLMDIMDNFASQNINNSLEQITKKINCLQDSFNKKMKDVAEKQTKIEQKLNDVIKKIDNIESSEPLICVSQTTQTDPDVTSSETQTENISVIGLNTQGREDNTPEVPDSQPPTGAGGNTDRDELHQIDSEVITNTEESTPPNESPKATLDSSTEDVQNVPFSKSTTTSPKYDYDLLIIGNSNTKKLTTDMFFTKHDTHIVTLKNKTVVGATKFIRNIQISARIVVYHIGINELAKLSNENLEKNFQELVNTTIKSMNIPTENILITSLPCYNFQRVQTPNRIIKDTCAKTGCSFLTLQLRPSDFIDEVHLNDDGLEVLTSAIKLETASILKIKTRYEKRNIHNRETNDSQLTSIDDKPCTTLENQSNYTNDGDNLLFLLEQIMFFPIFTHPN